MIFLVALEVFNSRLFDLTPVTTSNHATHAVRFIYLIVFTLSPRDRAFITHNSAPPGLHELPAFVIASPNPAIHMATSS